MNPLLMLAELAALELLRSGYQRTLKCSYALSLRVLALEITPLGGAVRLH